MTLLIVWQQRHADALNLIIETRADYVRQVEVARQTVSEHPRHYAFTLGELSTRFGLAPNAIASCFDKQPGKSRVALTTATAILGAAEHLRVVGNLDRFAFHSYRAQRLAEDNEDRDPTVLVTRMQPVAKKMGCTVPEAMEAVRKVFKLPVGKATVRRWCSNNRPLHVKEAFVFRKFLSAIEQMRDDKEIEPTMPTNHRFAQAFRA
jgi:hypothetical protein